MIMIDFDKEKELEEFARAAAKHFEKNPQHTSFSEKELEAGCLIALRWGLGDDCVLVLKIDDFEQPRVYQRIIERPADDQHSG